ncbi:MAG: HlyD family type I secretion periplasmic adaptor subunit [Gammaproteobacteria bacterium]|nr:HlyD family type I secretion periplasmic adaptor subunit [Gammaproteobacteria bacterium]
MSALSKREARVKRQEMEFLPAALEIQETPPAPIAHAIVWAIILFFSIAVGWAIVGQVDIVAVAHGKIIPSGRVKVIQPLETSVVRAILVDDGQRVEEGQVLIELDTTISGADRDRLITERTAAELDKARNEALLKAIREPGTAQDVAKSTGAALLSDAGQVVSPPGTKVTELQLQLQQNRLEKEYGEYQGQLAEIDHEIKEQNAERAATLNRIQQLEATIPLITERAEALKKLLETHSVARVQWLELEQERIEQMKGKDVQRDQLAKFEAEVGQLNEKRHVFQAQYETKWLAELSDIETRIAVYDQELIKAEQRQTTKRLTAPISGIVQQLAVHTVGGVVTPAQELMLIVPDDEHLEAEAWIQNKDIGFVHEGQEAEVKIEAFPFTKYGTIDGEIVNLTNDAVPDEKLGLVYAANVGLEKSTIQVEDKLVNLSPGMAVTVEVKTGKRRLIEYLMSPLLRYKDESVKER